MSESKVLDRRNLPIFIHSEIDDLQLTPNAFRVYAHLARRADKTGAAWPSYQSIGDHCFSMVFENPVTRRSMARKAIDELIAAGLIRKTNRATEAGNTSNIYELLNPVPIKHTPVPIDTPMPIEHTPVPIDTDVPNMHQRYSNEGTPFEGTPLKGDAPPPVNDYFGMAKPFRRERVVADGYTQDAAGAGVDAETYVAMFNKLVDIAGWRRLVDAGSDNELNWAKRDTLALIRMDAAKNVDQVQALIDAYAAEYPKRKNPKPKDIAEYASQVMERQAKRTDKKRYAYTDPITGERVQVTA